MRGVTKSKSSFSPGMKMFLYIQLTTHFDFTNPRSRPVLNFIWPQFVTLELEKLTTSSYGTYIYPAFLVTELGNPILPLHKLISQSRVTFRRICSFIVGDGDCGYMLRDGAKQVLQFIEGKDLAKLPETLFTLVNDLEVNMGGTSGALYCIYLTAVATALSMESTVAEALKAALEQLYKYINARLGDRTDALIPYIDTLISFGDPKEA
ncbi:hypothetical protein LTR37_018823 [Vermiconidia calcicola]|uniref:Uncharacterized protein n=1 Tax=Vermiconidia calcicola TaxID=1690605 RepID=A0ACC3MHP4_9PEZI|nr:hypothetical protein LTR37_018823 [Vermiconidia calcicola]